MNSFEDINKYRQMRFTIREELFREMYDRGLIRRVRLEQFLDKAIRKALIEYDHEEDES